ncbi:MAG: FliM/FliN family flagellar motor switch protein [Opitutaceae bacterium]|nr:FliM/FliN family flagellar motor switch protein [Verrucomicrobiales bacterium]
MEAGPTIPESEQVLSQSEVESLLVQVARQEADPAAAPGEGVAVKPPRNGAQPFDFRQPVFLSGGELRRLRQRHEEFINALAARLSIYLRMDFGLSLTRLDTITYEKFTEALATPTHLTLFKIEPLRGICILEMHPRLGLTIVDRLMGGAAQSVNTDHPLSEIEMALHDQAVQVILNEWCGHWSGSQDLRPVLLGNETSGRYLQTAPPDTVMLALTLEARLGDCLEQLQICFPCYTLEPLTRQLNQNFDATAKEAAAPVTVPLHWNPQFDEVLVPITAEWQGVELLTRQIAQLKIGDMVTLDPQCAGQITLRLAGRPKFTGRLGTQAEQWAVEVTSLIKD